MSVLINGMDMPKDCGECHFCHTENFHQWCCLTEETISVMDTKHFMCPLEEVEPCGDAVSRQAAIDIERNATVDTNPSHFEAHQKFTQFMDDAEISSFGRWQWSNGFNTALTAVGIDLKKLPSAKPERKCEGCRFTFYAKAENDQD